METVTHHGRTTAYRYQDGEGPTLLFVHGSGSTHDNWREQFAALPYPMAAVDLSGHGESDDVDAAPGPEALAAYGEDVAAVAGEVGGDVLIGNSLGGAVVFQVALEEDVGERGLVFVGSGAKLAVREDILDALQNDFEAYLEDDPDPDAAWQRDPELVERSTRTTRETGQAVTYRDFETCNQFDVRDRLSEIETPTLAITGEHDEMTFPWYHEYLADNMPNATWEIIEDAGHGSMLDQPEAFNERLSAFVEGLR